MKSLKFKFVAVDTVVMKRAKKRSSELWSSPSFKRERIWKRIHLACRKISTTRFLARARLRAIIEIDGGQLKIMPLSDSDYEEKLILDALRFMRQDFRQ